PTLVRTQHLPPPAETAHGLGIPGLAGRLSVVPLCVMVCRCEPLHSSGYGHMADGIRPEPAVHRTACSWISTPTVLGEEPARRRKITGGPTVWPTHGPRDLHAGARTLLISGEPLGLGGTVPPGAVALHLR